MDPLKRAILGMGPTVLHNHRPLRSPAAARPGRGRGLAPSAQAPIHACRIAICSRCTKHNAGPLSCHSRGPANTPGPCF